MSHDILNQFDRVVARFAPRRTDDLRPAVLPWIGLTSTWVAWKRIPEGHPHAGEWAMLPEGDVLIPPRWSPLGDLEIVEGGGSP